MTIQSTVSDSAYFDSEEQVVAISNSKEQDDGISNSDKQVDAVSEAKACRDYIIRNEFETMNVFEQVINSGNCGRDFWTDLTCNMKERA